MPLVGARPGDNADHAPGSEAVTRVKVVSDDLEFLGRIGVGKRRCQQVIVVQVVGAIQEIHRAALASATAGGAALDREGGVTLMLPYVALQNVRGPGCQQNQIG